MANTVDSFGENGQLMADLSGTSPDENYEAGVLNFIDQAIKDGEGILRDEPAYDEIDRSIAYIMGDQIDKMRPSELSNVPDNRLKNILNQTVAGLTDIHPLFGFKTYNPGFKQQEDILIKLSQSWWVNTFADLKLADVIKFSAGVGTGYCEVAWDASASGGMGDIILRPLDPRDVLPIKPSLGGGIQDWGGVIIRTAKSPDEMKIRFPDKAHRIEADNQPSVVARTWTRARRLMASIVSPSAVDYLNSSGTKNAPKRLATLDVHTIYLKDRRLWVGAQPKIMGDPSTTWSYTVYPVGYDQVPDGNDANGLPKFRKAKLEDSKLYPRGRMIVATKKCVLYDGPNPYWHGMFPVAKLSLDPWPWSILGIGLIHDIIPIQDALNETLNGIMDHVRKLLRPAIVADKKVTATSNWERIDTRLPGLKLKVPSASGGKAIEFVSPEPLPQYTFEVLKFLCDEMDYHAGTANMASLAQLQQTPGENTIEKLQEAMSPVLRLKGRLLEFFLRDIGEMVKANFFQFYNMPRRVQMLGEPGIDFHDFDFDPGSLVPAMSIDDPDYTMELDKSKSRGQRAQWYHKQFTFSITPNSLLAISQVSRKLMYMQLRQMGLVDRWTLWEVLEVPNGGTPPGDPVTISDRLLAEQMITMQQQLGAALMMGGAPGGGGPPGDGGGGPPGNPQKEGRPPSFQKSPTLLAKKTEHGIPRQTISSSGSGGHK